jgi:hypothetical protein
VLTEYPLSYPRHLVAETEVIIAKAVKKFPTQDLILPLIEYVIARMKPVMMRETSGVRADLAGAGKGGGQEICGAQGGEARRSHVCSSSGCTWADTANNSGEHPRHGIWRSTEIQANEEAEAQAIASSSARAGTSFAC